MPRSTRSLALVLLLGLLLLPASGAALEIAAGTVTIEIGPPGAVDTVGIAVRFDGTCSPSGQPTWDGRSGSPGTWIL